MSPVELDRLEQSEKCAQFCISLEKALSSHLPIQEEAFQREIYLAARYALLSGGKRLRPLLLFAVTDSLGLSEQKVLDVACAIEMIHTYSLIHDDLPCMDDDLLRRGKPTVHVQFSEAIAVLAGDLLLTKPYEVISCSPHLTAQQKVELFKAIGKAAGAEGLIGGQTVDISMDGKISSVQLQNWIAQRKTGALFALSLQCGAIIANAQRELYLKLEKIGLSFGLVYQMIDDLLDYTHSSDQKNEKITFVQIYGIDKTQQIVTTLLNSLLEEIKQLPFCSALLLHLLSLLNWKNSEAPHVK